MKNAATLLLIVLMICSPSICTVTATESIPAEDAVDKEIESADITMSDAAYDTINPTAYRISNSSYLRLPDDLCDCAPIIPPEPREVEGMEDPTAVEIYNVATGATIRIPSNDATQQSVECDIDSIPPYQGLLPPGIVPEIAITGDGRSQITNTENYPWRTICKLYSTYPNGLVGGCSGAIIGCPDGHGYQVLTAGHCVHSPANGGWATSVEVVPGLDGTYMPYNYALSTNIRSYTGWTVSGDPRHDWALVTLDRNVGDYTGWMGVRTASSSDSIYTGILNTAGYPSDKPAGTMWFDSDYGRTADEYNHWYYMYTWQGQSGSPVYSYSSGNRSILTIHAYGDDGSGSNHGTRLNQAKFDSITTWCNSDTPPTDKADLIDDGPIYSSFSPTVVKPGTTSFHGGCDVRNIGTASSGGFDVSYYAAMNTYISTSDYLIGTDYVSSISPFEWRGSNWTGTFPSGAPDGEYYVGWIIDSGSNVAEFDENNNKEYKDSYKLLVDGTDPSASISINSGTTYTDTTSVTLSLTYSDSGSGVDTCRYNNSGGSWTGWQSCSSSKSWTLSSGDGSKTVYYEVKDKAGNVKQVSDSITVGFLPGDLNHDGTLTSADAAIALEIAVGSRPCDPATLAAADASSDGKVTSLDALMIMQVAAGAISL